MIAWLVALAGWAVALYLLKELVMQCADNEKQRRKNSESDARHVNAWNKTYGRAQQFKRDCIRWRQQALDDRAAADAMRAEIQRMKAKGRAQ